MNKSELLQLCKDMGIKGVSSKTKNEILLIINEKKQEIITEPKLPNRLTDVVLNELISKTPKDKLRKVCKNCNEIGHIHAKSVYLAFIFLSKHRELLLLCDHRHLLVLFTR